MVPSLCLDMDGHASCMFNPFWDSEHGAVLLCCALLLCLVWKAAIEKRSIKNNHVSESQKGFDPSTLKMAWEPEGRSTLFFMAPAYLCTSTVTYHRLWCKITIKETIIINQTRRERGKMKVLWKHLFCFCKKRPQFSPSWKLLHFTKIVRHFRAGISWHQRRTIFLVLLWGIHPCRRALMMTGYELYRLKRFHLGLQNSGFYGRLGLLNYWKGGMSHALALAYDLHRQYEQENVATRHTYICEWPWPLTRPEKSDQNSLPTALSGNKCATFDRFALYSIPEGYFNICQLWPWLMTSGPENQKGISSHHGQLLY